MKNILKYGLGIFGLMFSMASCGDFEPTGYEEAPSLPNVSNLKAQAVNHTMQISWTLPSKEGLSQIVLIKNADTNNPVKLEPTETSYDIIGLPMGDNLVTLKLVYNLEGRTYTTEGETITANLPVETWPAVGGVKTTVLRRNVTVSWDAVDDDEITGYRVLRNGAAVADVAPDVTSVLLKSQPMEESLVYSVVAVHDTYYYSEAGNAPAVEIPYIQQIVGFLLLADTPDDLPDDDEVAAAKWFAEQRDTKFVRPSEVAALDPQNTPVLWIMVDRVGMGKGIKNLPQELRDCIADLKAYSAKGGGIYLSNMATQLVGQLGMTPADMIPNLFADGGGGTGNDVWTINALLGIDFKENGEQGYYDRTTHAIFSGLEFADPNGWGYESIPLIGPGQREDHNCMWDLNAFGKGDAIDVVANFEATCGCLVLATWGQVRDHCVAGLVTFDATEEHGACVANGFAAYEFNQNSGANPYQKNIYQLTANIFDFLK